MCVVDGEVDGLRDFWVGLRDGLVCLVGCDVDEAGAVIRQLVCHGLEDGSALCAGLRAPCVGKRRGGGYGSVDGLRISDLVDTVVAWVLAQQLMRPLAVGFQGWVGVWLVGEAATAWGLAAFTRSLFFDAVLGALWAGEGLPAVFYCRAEVSFLLLNRGAGTLVATGIALRFIRREQRVEEVLAGGVLLQAAD